jgi:hypothetical protein
MTLLALKKHMQVVKKTSLYALCRSFKTDPVHVKQLLLHWQCKGCVRLCEQKSACGKRCFGCDLASSERYEWVGDAAL